MELSNQAKASLTAAGIDWRAALAKVTPLLLEIIAALLTRKAMASADAVPDCHAGCLDKAIADQVSSLHHLVHLRECCPCPPTPPA